MKPRLFFLDDDPPRLDAWREELADWGDRWELRFFDQREELHAAIAAGPPSIVVTREALVEAPGRLLLDEIGKHHPDVRLILLAPRDQREALRATVDENITLLPAPCPAETLTTELNRLLSIEHWLGNERLSAVIARAGSMPSLPNVYTKVMNLLESGVAALDQVAKLVAQDVAMSAKLLQVANSSYFGIGEQVSDIKHAVTMLGTELVKHIVLAIQVFRRYGKTADERALVDQIWRHSMSVAQAARKIALYQTADEDLGEEAYTAGLFHDMGKLILLNARPDDFQRARELARTENRLAWEAEDSVLGCNHAEVGAYLLGVWQMPLPIIEAVAFHHQPERSVCQGFSTLAAVHAANALVWARSGLPDHPEAQAHESFLASIGCLEHLEEWSAVIRGQEPLLETDADGRTHARVVLRPRSARDEDFIDADEDQGIGSDPLVDDASRASADEVDEAEPAPVPPVVMPESEPVKASPPSASTPAAPAPSSVPAPGRESSNRFGLVLAVAACLLLAAAVYLVLRPGTPSPTPADASSEEAAVNVAEAPREAPLVSVVSPPPSPAVETSIPPLEATESPNSETEDRAESGSPAAKPFPTLQLSGIYYRPNKPAAVINGEIHYIGDELDGALITAIGRASVEVSFADEIRLLTLE